MTAEFQYTSVFLVEPYGGPNDVRWTLAASNIGDEPGLFNLEIYERMQIPGGIQWSGFSLKDIVSVSMAVGEERTFTGQVNRGPYTYQLMAKSEAGTLLNPSEPKEFICSCCTELYGRIVSFATAEELDTHFSQEHPEYLPMDPLTGFQLKCLAWPEHFTKYGEDYGRIIAWRAICLLDESDYEPDADWRLEYLPDSGGQLVDISETLHFTMPAGWIGARRGPCGRIPNSTIIRLFFETDQGWSGFLDDSPWLLRIPDGSLVTFGVSESGAGSWQVEAPEEPPEPPISPVVPPWAEMVAWGGMIVVVALAIAVMVSVAREKRPV